jgi:hypothetical protein
MTKRREAVLNTLRDMVGVALMHAADDILRLQQNTRAQQAMLADVLERKVANFVSELAHALRTRRFAASASTAAATSGNSVVLLADLQVDN